MPATRDTIPMNDLRAVLNAALLLRLHGFISAEQLREVRQTVHEDCNVWFDVLQGQSGSDAEFLKAGHPLNAIWKDTRPL